MALKKIAVFVSGRGSNLSALINRQREFAYEISLVFVSKKDALAIEVAKDENIPVKVLDKSTFLEETVLIDELKLHEINFICLAGFLWKVPSYLIKAYPNEILNIHPSLLPKHGGKGMYGMKVHEAVIQHKDTESGITIHLVNEEYDKGKILFQTKIPIEKNESPLSLSKRILALEHRYFPEVLHRLCTNEK